MLSIFNLSDPGSDYIIIIGCGRLGSTLANQLSDEGGNVMVIDHNRDSMRKLSPSFGGLTLIGDGTNLEILTEAQIKNAHYVIVVTDDDNTNIMISQLAKELFHVPHVIARLYDPERECVYKELDIETISPSMLSAYEIKSLMQKPRKVSNQ